MKRNYTITDAERQKRSDRAKRQHERGEFGGPEFGRLGGKKKAENLHTHLAGVVRKDENQKKISDRLMNVIEHGNDREAGNMIKTALALDVKEYEITRREDRELEQLERAELVATVVDGLRELVEAGLLDGSIVEDGEWNVSDRAIGPGSGDQD